MSIFGNKAIWMLLGALAAAGLVLWFFMGSEPFTLTVLFDDIGALKKGDPVVWKSFSIGKVDRIEPMVENKIGVTIRIQADYAPRVTQGSEFLLRQSSFLGLVGDNAIEVVLPPVAGAPYERGTRVQGTVPIRPSALEAGRQWTIERLRQLGDETSALLEELRSSPMRAEAEAALLDFRRILENGAGQAKEGLEQFRRDHQAELDAALRRLESVRDELLRQGNDRAARQLERQIEKMRPKR